MAHTLLLKRSSTTTATPTSGQLSAGELAINTTDEAIFFKNNGGTVKKLSAMSDLTSNLVTIATTQSISGAKTFTSAAVFSSNIAVNGTDITTTSTSFNIANSTATAIYIGTGAAIDLRFGKTDNTGTVRIFGTLLNAGGVISTGAAAAQVFNTTATTVDVGGAATSMTLGATASTTITLRGGTLLGNTATQNVFNSTATIVNAFGAATSLYLGATSGTAFLKNATVTLGNTTASVNTTSGATNHLTIAPFGDLTLAPTAATTVGGTRPSLLIENDDAATGRMRFSGGDVDLLVEDTGVGGSAPISLRFFDSDLSNFVALRANSSIANNNTYTLPSAVGAANQVLTISAVNGNDATLNWTTVSGAAGPTGPAGQSTSDVHYLLFQAGVI